MLSLDKKEEAGDFCREWYLQDEDDPTAATALIYTWIAGGRLKEAQKIVDRWMEKKKDIRKRMRRFSERRLF